MKFSMHDTYILAEMRLRPSYKSIMNIFGCKMACLLTALKRRKGTYREEEFERFGGGDTPLTLT